MRHVRCFLRYVYGLAMRPTRGGCEDGYADASGLVPDGPAILGFVPDPPATLGLLLLRRDPAMK